MNYQLIVFDWDGTLMDSVAKIVNSMRNAAAVCGLTKPEHEAVRDIIGLSLDVAVQRLFPDVDSTMAEHVRHHYSDQYANHDTTPTPLFDGAMDLLLDLKQDGFQLAVATGKSRRGLNRVMNLTETVELFDTSRCAEEAESKPSPQMLHHILEELGLAPHQALMVGDSEYDLMMAKAAGMDRVGVSFGVHGHEKLSQHDPLDIIHELGQLRQYL